jgi:hypothetical protein
MVWVCFCFGVWVKIIYKSSSLAVPLSLSSPKCLWAWLEDPVRRSLCVIENLLHAYFWHLDFGVIFKVNFKCITRNDKKWRFSPSPLAVLYRVKKSSEIGTWVSMTLVTLNFYITSSPIQMSSQSTIFKYFENLPKSFSPI